VQVSNETYEEVMELTTKFVDQLGELEPSIEGYIDVLKAAIEEITVSLVAAKDDLENEMEDLG
jgi:archaellum component FlaC